MLTKQGNGPGLLERESRAINADLIRRAAAGEIVSFDRAFSLGGESFKINRKERLKFTHALCDSEDSADEIEETFARLTSNKREAFGRDTTEQHWRPSLTLGTLLVTEEKKEKQFFMCITPACNMMRISGGRKEVVLLCLKKTDTQFNLVVRDSETSNVKLRVPTEFSDMSAVEFRVDRTTRRITGTLFPSAEGRQFTFETTRGGIQYKYLGQLRYLRALRDLSEIVRNSTAIGIADSEWLRLSGRD